MPNKLIVLSYDSLQAGDLKKLRIMPNFSEIWERAAVVHNIREIYPTLTYPIHTTLITGLYPDKHGIMHNQKPSIDPKEPDFSLMGSDWYWEKENIKAKTLVDTVLDEGRSVATSLWPVTAGEKRGWNLPEIWPVREASTSAREVYSAAASDNVMSDYYDRFIGKYIWHNNKDMVAYSVEIALDILGRHTPDLMLCHLTHLDHTRHVYGGQNREVDDCLRRLDIIAGRFIETARAAGTLDKTNFVILGDHGQIDVKKLFFLNLPFKDCGLIHVAGGRVESYEAYAFSAGFSAHIILKNPNDRFIKDKVGDLLNKLMEDYPEYIEAVYTSEEIHETERLAGEFSFVVEAREGVLLQNDITGVESLVMEPGAFDNAHVYKSMHGHHPNKGEKPPFVAFGPGVKPGMHIENGDIIDIAQTLFALAGVPLPQSKGNPLPVLETSP